MHDLLPQPKFVPPPISGGSTRWMREANCIGANQDLFFPTKGHHKTHAEVLETNLLCHGCKVREACLDYAIGNHIKYGIWGGLTESQRRRLTRQATAQTKSQSPVLVDLRNRTRPQDAQ